MLVFWVMTPRGLVVATIVSEAVCSCETLILKCKSTRRHNSKANI
jgi:hypothetical protein